MTKRQLFITISILFILLSILVSLGAYREDCKAKPYCSQHGDKEHVPCGKCEMECNGEGKKPDNDRRCSTFCCEDHCDCSPPCS